MARAALPERAADLRAASGGSVPDCFAAVPDPRGRRGRRHSLPSVLTLVLMAVLRGRTTLAGITAWIAHAGQDLLAAAGARTGADGRRQAPCGKTVTRLPGLIGAQALADAVACYLAAAQVPESPAYPLAGPVLQPHLACDGKEVRGAVRPDGTSLFLLSAAAGGSVIAEREIPAKTNEIPEIGPMLLALNTRFPLAGRVLTADALHTQRALATLICESLGAHYVFTVEHASHCSCCWSWRVKESSLAVSGLDTESFAASLGEVDGVELAALDLVQHGLAGDAEAGGGLAEGQPAVGGLGPDPVAELLVDADLPGCSGGELLTGDEAVA